MTRKHYWALLLLLSLAIGLPGQKETSIWNVRTRLSLDWTTGSPDTLATSSQIGHEGCATVCDTAGNLLFYTNGETVWDRTDSMMLNGFDIGGYQSSWRGVAAARDPGNCDRYWLFLVDGISNPGPGFPYTHVYDSVLAYSIVDMNANNGLGAVVVKDAFIDNQFNECISGIHHANRKDVWVAGLTVSRDEIHAYLLTDQGLSGPVISPVPDPTPADTMIPWACNIEFSPNGRQAVLMGLYPRMFDFDPFNGTFSNPRFIDTTGTYTGFNYCSFSPNSQLLYYAKPDKRLYQVDLTAGHPDSILATRVEIWRRPWIRLFDMQLAVDGKLYFADARHRLNIIHNPDVPGPGCNLQEAYVRYPTYRYFNSWPAFLESYFDPEYSSDLYYTPTTALFNYSGGNCPDDTLRFENLSTGGVREFFWEFGDGATDTAVAPQHAYSAPGDYLVQLVTKAGCATDTFVQWITVDSFAARLDLPDSIRMCAGDRIYLQTGIPNATTYWSTGETTSVITVEEPGTFHVGIHDVCGDDSATVVVYNDEPEAEDLIPNVFTPNDDGVNDVFRVEGIQPEGFFLRIYDRWGRLQWESRSPSRSWNGQLADGPAPEGVYFLRIDYRGCRNELLTHTANVLLMR